MPVRRKDKRVPKAQQDDVVAQSGKVAERYVLVLDRELEELAKSGCYGKPTTSAATCLRTHTVGIRQVEEGPPF